MSVTTETLQPSMLDGVLETDTVRLRHYVMDADEQLAALPEPQERDARARERAGRIYAGCRAFRDRFLVHHADQVYDELTDKRARRIRLAELAHAAAERFPGLVPSAQELIREGALRQAQKESREIDQGIFFRALLRSPVAGPHLLDAMLHPTERALKLRERFHHTGVIELPTVSLRRDGQAARVTFHNVSCLNAEDEQFVDDLETAVDLALLDNAIRIGVLRGGVMTHPRYEGRRVFCSGINLRELQAGRISLTGFLLRREMGLLAKLIHGLVAQPDGEMFQHRTVQKPWAAVVDSFAIGGGMQMLLAVDRVIAADDAYFSLPAANEGIVPGVANFRLGRFFGARPVRQLLLGGRRIYATEPDGRLIADEVVSAAAVDDRITAAVTELAAPAVAANRRMLNLAEEPVDRMLGYLAEYAYVQATRLYARDVLVKEGVPTDPRRTTVRRGEE